mmetsp:Transcript_1209/g.2630  ORF Transcript_1209/g.2630 Transcript_1209/m.2630 type:complete len:182 (-) Transcript_1209:267-812(-)
MSSAGQISIISLFIHCIHSKRPPHYNSKTQRNDTAQCTNPMIMASSNPIRQSCDKELKLKRSRKTTTVTVQSPRNAVRQPHYQLESNPARSRTNFVIFTVVVFSFCQNNILTEVSAFLRTLSLTVSNCVAYFDDDDEAPPRTATAILLTPQGVEVEDDGPATTVPTSGTSSSTCKENLILC